MDESDRIEIELTSSGGPTRADGAAIVGSTPSSTSVPDRRTWWVVVGVGVVALLVGWALGRSGNSTDASPEPRDSGPVTATTDLDVSAEVTLPAPSAASTTTTPASSADAVGSTAEGDREPPVLSIREFDVAEALVGQPIEVIVYGNGRQLTQIDLGSGVGSEQLIDRQPFGPSVLHVGSDWIVIPTFQTDLPSLLVADGLPAVEVDIGPAWTLIGVEDDALWQATFATATDDESQVQRISPTGDALGDSTTVPFVPLGLDPAGGLLTVAPGGVYQVANGDPVRITTGDLMALSDATAVATECDPSLVCTTVRIDRATGERQVIAIDDFTGPIGGEFAPLPREHSISPDDTTAVFAVRALSGTGQEVLFALDIDTGAVTDIGIVQQGARLGWTPDSRYVLFVRGGRLTAFDLEDGTAFTVSNDLFAVETFSVRSITGP